MQSPWWGWITYIIALMCCVRTWSVDTSCAFWHISSSWADSLALRSSSSSLWLAHKWTGQGGKGISDKSSHTLHPVQCHTYTNQVHAYVCTQKEFQEHSIAHACSVVRLYIITLYVLLIFSASSLCCASCCSATCTNAFSFSHSFKDKEYCGLQTKDKAK